MNQILQHPQVFTIGFVVGILFSFVLSAIITVIILRNVRITDGTNTQSWEKGAARP